MKTFKSAGMQCKVRCILEKKCCIFVRCLGNLYNKGNALTIHLERLLSVLLYHCDKIILCLSCGYGATDCYHLPLLLSSTLQSFLFINPAHCLGFQAGYFTGSVLPLSSVTFWSVTVSVKKLWKYLLHSMYAAPNSGQAQSVTSWWT